MRRRAVAWVLALCLLWVGCTDRSTKPVVKIGLVAPFEGRYRAVGYEVLDAVERAVRERNEAGGVGGYMVELVALDDGDDPQASAFQARKFGVDRDVMGVIGPFSDAALQAAAPVYHELGLPAVTPTTCSPSLVSAGYEEIFCAGAGIDALGQSLLEQLPEGDRAVLVDGTGGPLADWLSLRARDMIVLPVSKDALDEMHADPAEAYVYDGNVLSAADWLIGMRAVGIDAPVWGGPSLARVQLPQIAGGAAVGVCYVVTAPLFSGLYPGDTYTVGDRDAAGTTAGPWAGLAYDAATLLLMAIEEATDSDVRPTRDGVRAHLADVRGPDGLAVFVDGQRRQTETGFYCYAKGEDYPGRLSRKE